MIESAEQKLVIRTDRGIGRMRVIIAMDPPEGDNLVLFYGSANRDEALFEDPDTFRIDRHPNPHLGFGIGEHFCLGAHLARASQRALLSELIRRIDSFELAGEPERIHSSFVVGLKKLPLRYRVSDGRD